MSGGRILGLALGWLLAYASLAQTPPADVPPAAAPTAVPSQPADSSPPDSPPADSSTPASALKPTPPTGRSGLRVVPSTRKKAARPVSTHTSPYHGDGLNDKTREFFSAAWGIDRLRVNYTMSGNLIRFSFRVVQPKIAKALGDHEATPYLYAPRVSAMLQVPNMEQVGQLRQMHTEEANKDYWMVFSNKGNLVHRGDRVNVIIGKFHADGLVVE